MSEARFPLIGDPFPTIAVQTTAAERTGKNDRFLWWFCHKKL